MNGYINVNRLNETVTCGISFKKSMGAKRIICRTGDEGGYDNKRSKHSPTIKIKKTKIKDNGTPVVVPLCPIDEFNSSNFYTDLLKFNNQERDFIHSFVCENQIYILAYWFNLNTKISEIIKDMFDTKIAKDIENKLYQKKLKPKTRDELEKDKEDIIKYVRNKLKDDKVIISFSSYTK